MQQVSVLETNIGSSTTGNSANTQIIFNDNGTLRGDAGLTYNAATDTLSAGSATITGDLTVDTSTLKVDSTNNRVGIRTASPAEPLTVDNSSGVTTGAIRIYAIDQSHSRLAIQNGNGQAYHLVAGNPGASNAGFALYDNTAAATRLYVDSTGVHTWQNVGGVAGTAMTLNANGLGIGVTPSAWSGITALQISRGSFASDTGSYTLNHNVFNNGSNRYIATAAAMQFQAIPGTGFLWNIAPSGTAGNAITFTQAMTLDASGNLLVGTTTPNFTNTNGFVVAQTTDATYISVGHVTGTATGAYYCSFGFNGTQIGSITQNGTTGVLYNINSDYRLKESVAPLSGGLARVSALKPSIYKWKSDGSSGEGFLAHELAEVVPFAVTGEKDAVNEDGTMKTQGIDMSRVVPILVAAIQELTARVQTLEAK